MTGAQFFCLKWLARHGGTARVDGHLIIAFDKSVAEGRALVCFMHLVALGAIAGDNGELLITAKGRRYLDRTETGDLI